MIGKSVLRGTIRLVNVIAKVLRPGKSTCWCCGNVDRVTVVVAGVVNVEVAVPVGSLPVPYAPVRYCPDQLRTSVSGVGFNVAAAVSSLGGDVRLASYLGEDGLGSLGRAALARRQLDASGVLTTRSTPQSVVLTGRDGMRSVFTDLKGLPDEIYPTATFNRLLDGADLAVLSTIGFARGLLPVARMRGVPIAVDLQTIESADDPYLQDWLAHADILFCSHEQLPVSAAQWATLLLQRCSAGIVVVGCGAEGCLYQLRGEARRQVPAVAPRGVVNTVGAGDALLAAFVHGITHRLDPRQAIERAVLFAGWKVGGASGSDGLLTSLELDRLYATYAGALAGGPPGHRLPVGSQADATVAQEGPGA